MRRALLCVLLALAGCGGPLSQPAARDLATARSCDWVAKCGEIGSGKSYASRDACEVGQRNDWNNRWSVGKCDGKVIPSDLDLGLKAIDSTSCGNALDILNTVYNKCSEANVCKG
ncbi:MAG: hypothetical protein H6Q89_3669 [Myxococcaceae bacterium]|nr:hypothetical protein [Myxococcaceae bacterium]